VGDLKLLYDAGLAKFAGFFDYQWYMSVSARTDVSRRGIDGGTVVHRLANYLSHSCEGNTSFDSVGHYEIVFTSRAVKQGEF